MRTSYSAISTYLQCPQKFKFQEIDRIRAPKSREALFGTLIHSALQFMFKSDPLFPTVDEVVNFYREHWPPAETWQLESRHDPLKRSWTAEDEKIYFEEGVKILRKFYEKNPPWNFSVLALESKFEVTLADENTGDVHVLSGKIDRIDKTGDHTYEIIDYKTARRMPSQESVNKDLQLALYSLGLQRRWPHVAPDHIQLTLYFVKHGEKLSTTASVEKTEATKKEILKRINEIQKRLQEEKSFEPMPGPLCDWCSYRPICPAWKHLYKKQEPEVPSQEAIDTTIHEFFELQKDKKNAEIRIKELQEAIKTYMEAEGLTRVFGNNGYLSKKTQQRYAYDMERIRELLSPIGKWEAVLKADETRLKKILGEIPEDIRAEVLAARSMTKEFTTLTASAKKITRPKTRSSPDTPEEP